MVIYRNYYRIYVIESMNILMPFPTVRNARVYIFEEIKIPVAYWLP